MRETRVRLIPEDDAPDGWRRGAQWLRDDGTMAVLWTNAPVNHSPYDFDYRFIVSHPVHEEREVTEWTAFENA